MFIIPSTAKKYFSRATDTPCFSPLSPPQSMQSSTQLIRSCSFQRPEPSKQTPAPIARDVPAEIWLHITTFLEDDELYALRSVNRAFLASSLDRTYQVLALTAPTLDSIKSRWKDVLNYYMWKARRFRESEALPRCRTLVVSPWIEFALPDLIEVEHAPSFFRKIVQRSYSSIIFNSRFPWVATPKAVSQEFVKTIRKLRNIETLEVQAIRYHGSWPFQGPEGKYPHCSYIDTAWSCLASNLVNLSLSFGNMHQLRAVLPVNESTTLPRLKTFKLLIQGQANPNLGEEKRRVVNTALTRLSCLLSQSPRLQQFRIRALQSAPSVDLTKIFPMCVDSHPELRSINLLGFNRSGEQSKMDGFISAYCNQLTELTFASRTFTGLPFCTRLVHLDLSIYPSGKLQAHELESAVKYLKYLRLSFGGMTPSWDLSKILGNCQALEELILDVTPFPIALLVGLARQVPSLRVLDICTNEMDKCGSLLELAKNLKAPLPRAFMTFIQKAATPLQLWALTDLTIRTRLNGYFPLYGMMVYVARFIPSIKSFGRTGHMNLPPKDVYSQHQKDCHQHLITRRGVPTHKR